ncbi:MAG: transposase [Candidatus Omnitrophica bacterium]|nr:transposase [Candidatus Omnitrophota bacterium]
MSRPLRIEYPNAFYHIMNRGASRQPIYLIDDDYEMFLEAVKESAKFFNVRVICYCLMPNHYHLLIQTPKANLSRAMRHLNGVYTQRFNRLHKKDGPLFRGRYKAILVQEDEYLTHLIRYIHLNPVQANLTQDLLKYPWTSHKDYLKGNDQAPWLHVRLGLAFFSSQLAKALKEYRQFMKDGVDLKTLSFYSKKKLNPILGDPDFLNHIKEKYILTDRKLSTEIPEERQMTGNAMIQRILKETSRAFSIPNETLYKSKRGELNQARLVAVALSRELSGLRLSEIADLFRAKSYRTIASSCHRFKKLLTSDSGMRRRYGDIQKRCSQEKI